MTTWFRKRRLDGVGDWVVVGLVALCLLAGAQWALINVENHIRVTSIVTHNTPVGDRIQMDVVRVLTGATPGKWSVNIREGASGALVCSSGLLPNDRFLMYREFIDGTDVRTTLPDPLYLDYWASGGCSDKLGSATTAAGLPVGLYSEETTHCMKPIWYLPMKCKTWPASTWRVVE